MYHTKGCDKDIGGHFFLPGLRHLQLTIDLQVIERTTYGHPVFLKKLFLHLTCCFKQMCYQLCLISIEILLTSAEMNMTINYQVGPPSETKLEIQYPLYFIDQDTTISQ